MGGGSSEVNALAGAGLATRRAAARANLRQLRYTDHVRPVCVDIAEAELLQSMARYTEGKAWCYRNPSRDTVAHIVDWNLWSLSQAEASLDLLMGEVLAEFDDKRLNKLGYVKISDFVREHLGLSERAGYDLVRNAAQLRKYPLLREAYVNRVLNKSSLRYILQVVTPTSEKMWIDAARRLTVKKLYELVKESEVPAFWGSRKKANMSWFSILNPRTHDPSEPSHAEIVNALNYTSYATLKDFPIA